MNHPHPNTLLEKAEGLLVVNLLEQASYISTDEVLAALVAPEPGLYIKGSVNPLLNSRESYYPKSLSGGLYPEAKIVDFKEALKLQEDIVTISGEVVVSAFNLINRPHLFTTEPTLPVSAINVCYNVLIDYLFKRCKYARGRKLNHFSNYIKPEYQDLIDEEYLEDSLSDALDELHEFTVHSPWNIYMHKLTGTTLIIEKLVDWRIYDWTEIMYNKQQEESSDFY